MLRRLHESGEQTAYPFDAWGEIQGFEESLRRFNRADFEDMQQMRDGIARLRAHLEADGTPVRLCHCDSYAPNFLLDRADKMQLIDWEYSGMSDPASNRHVHRLRRLYDGRGGRHHPAVYGP